MKVWIDGSWNQATKIGIGIIFENGETVRKSGFGYSSHVAEIIACLEALKYLDEKNIIGNVIYTDNLILSWIKTTKRKKHLQYLRPFKKQILSLLEKTKSEIVKIHHSKNKLADIEARLAIGLPLRK